MTIKAECNRAWSLFKVNTKRLFSKQIVTVSETSKNEICDYLRISRSKVSVIGNGWEHVLSIRERDEKQFSQINANDFYFSIGNMLPHKNMRWVIEEARHMTNQIFVIAGKVSDSLKRDLQRTASNVIFLGHISDEYMK